MRTEQAPVHMGVGYQTMMTGVVSSFDDPRGIGVITSGDALFGFHCAEIVDGTRTIEIGETVQFLQRPYHGGQVQAAHIVTV